MILGVMEKMRKSTGIILWILIFSFGILWMLSSTNVFSNVGAGARVMGSVNGTPISIQTFQQTVSNMDRVYSQRTGNSPTAEQRASFQELAWNRLVNTKILTQKMNQLGIVVTDAEVDSMIEGSNPAPLIRRQFTTKDGTFNRAAVRSFFTSPRYHQVAIAIQEQLRRQRRQQKMGNFIQAAVQVSPYEIHQQYIRHNTTVDISYVRFPYSEVNEDKIQVSTADLRQYYKNYQDKFHRKKSFRFQYVSFSKAPTKQDTARTIDELKKLRTDFAKAESDSSFLQRHLSSINYNPEYIEKEKVRKLFQQALPKLDDGQVSPVLQENGTVYIVKKEGEKGSKVKFSVLGRRIIADPVTTVDKQSRDADDFRYFAESGGFKKEANRRNLSIQSGLVTKGNTFIAGLGQSRQISNMIKDVTEGEITKPIELPGKFVVLKITNVIPEGTRSFDEVKDQIKTTVLAKKRKEQVKQHVEKLLGNGHSLKALAKASGNKINKAQSLAMSDETIPGSGREPKVIGSIFNLEKGELSAPILGVNAVYIVKVTNRKDANIKDLDAKTTTQIRQRLQAQKKSVFASVWLKQLKAQADIVDNRAELLGGR